MMGSPVRIGRQCGGARAPHWKGITSGEPWGGSGVYGGMKLPLTLSALAGALALAACSSPDEPASKPAGETTAAGAAQTLPAPTVVDAAKPAASEAARDANVLALKGLGDLRIGQAVPKASSWKERGAQTGDACRTVSSPDFPGAYAILEGGVVRRITVGQRSTVKVVEGIGVGSSEKDVVAAFPGFRSEPHKYVEAPAKYLTAPNAAGGDVALRFEIGQDGKVSMMHVGTMPVLGYVEGCG